MLKPRHRQPRSLKLSWVVRSAIFVLIIWTLVIGGLMTRFWSEAAHAQENRSPSQPPTPAQIDQFLPAPQPHGLPDSLNQWQLSEPGNDYFEQIQPTIAGYLIWSKFPVRVYLEPAAQNAFRDRSQAWTAAVTAAIQDWNAYLPLAIVSSPDAADIVVWRRTPPLQVDRSAAREPRARSAETRFTLLIDRTIAAAPVLSHRMTLWLGTNQTQGYLRAAARHELGHALGLWGHSPIASDVMYFAQVRQPPPISDRDLNTLKRLYQQPTRLGWAIPQTLNELPNLR